MITFSGSVISVVISLSLMDYEIELELINRFVRKTKRDRLKQFTAKPQKRDNFIKEFNSPGIFEPKLLTEIIGADRTPSNLLKTYRNHGMGEIVYLISENYQWDGQKMATKHILEQSVAMCTDVLGYCTDSKTAFFEWHHSNASYFLSAINAK